jgi:hypothetical protein
VFSRHNLQIPGSRADVNNQLTMTLLREQGFLHPIKAQWLVLEGSDLPAVRQAGFSPAPWNKLKGHKSLFLHIYL